MNIKKMIYVITGCIGASLGAVGAVVPMVQGNKAFTWTIWRTLWQAGA